MDLSAQSSVQLLTCQHNHQHNCGPVTTVVMSAQLWTCQQCNCPHDGELISPTADPSAQLGTWHNNNMSICTISKTAQHNYSTPVYVCQHTFRQHKSECLMRQNQVKSNVLPRFWFGILANLDTRRKCKCKTKTLNNNEPRTIGSWAGHGSAESPRQRGEVGACVNVMNHMAYRHKNDRKGWF